MQAERAQQATLAQTWGVRLQPHEPHEALRLWNVTTLPATGFPGFSDPQEQSAGTESVAALLPIESNQRTLIMPLGTRCLMALGASPGEMLLRMVRDGRVRV